jgi:hypothetical protein
MIIPPPIASRVYQTISRGFVNLLNAKKITDTRFPFPYAQLITFLLISHTFLTPMIMSGLIKSKVVCAAFTFVPVFGMFSLNFIASELENPFGTDANDLPLDNFQEEMNSCLLMLLHNNTDMIATTSDECVMNFRELLESMSMEPSKNINLRDAASMLDQKNKDRTEERGSTLSMPALPLQPPRTPLPAPIPPPTLELAPAAPTAVASSAPPPPPTATPSPPAQPPKQADSSARLVTKMEEFSSSLAKWTQMLDTNSKQMGQSFNALQVQNANLASLLKNGIGWESAVSPVP